MDKMDNSVKLFGDKIVRSVWDEENEKWWFAVVDVVEILTESPDPAAYWRKLKQRLKEEGSQTVTNCHGLKLPSRDGKMRLTDTADTEQLLRIIQSIPSKKAEPFKRWLAEVGSERLDQMADPEKSIKQALRDYRRLGYSEDWINQRLKSIEIRKDLTDTWDKHGVSGQQYATLTDIIYKTLAENADCAIAGGNVAKVAREQLESETGRKVVSSLSAEDIRTNKLSEAPKTPSNNIAMIRRMRGFSQAVMAEKLGISRQSYINIEKGLKELTVSQVRILEETFEVTFEDLLGVDTGNPTLDYRKFL